MSIFSRSLVLAVLCIYTTQTVSANTHTSSLYSEIGEQKNTESPFMIAFAKTYSQSIEKQDTVHETILNKWKLKQKTLWENLPSESFTINASAYTAAADECGGKSDSITASGVKVKENHTLACPANFPFGAKIEIDGYGIYTCEDRGGAIKGNHIDVYMKTKSEAFAFGRRNLEARIVQ